MAPDVRGFGDKECCPRPSLTRLTGHSSRCLARRQKWVIRRDCYSIDQTRPWTIWRWGQSINKYFSWGAFASQEAALAQVNEWIALHVKSADTTTVVV